MFILKRVHCMYQSIKFKAYINQGVSQEGKKFCVLHELENKTQLGVWAHCEPLSGLRATRGQST